MFIVWQLKKNQERLFLISTKDDLGEFKDAQIEKKWVVQSIEDARNILKKREGGQDAIRTTYSNE